MSPRVRLFLSFAIVAGCSRPPPSSPEHLPSTNSFQAGRAEHFASVDEMTRTAGQVLASSFEM